MSIVTDTVEDLNRNDIVTTDVSNFDERAGVVGDTIEDMTRCNIVEDNVVDLN